MVETWFKHGGNMVETCHDLFIRASKLGYRRHVRLKRFGDDFMMPTHLQLMSPCSNLGDELAKGYALIKDDSCKHNT